MSSATPGTVVLTAHSPCADAPFVRRCPEYATALTGLDAMRGKLRASQIGELFVSVSVTLRWPVRPGSAQQRSYSLLRFRQRPDLSVRVSYRAGDIECPQLPHSSGYSGMTLSTFPTGASIRW